MDFRVSKTRQVYHAECLPSKRARDLVESSVKVGYMLKRGGGWSMGLVAHEWIKRFVVFRVQPIVYYFDGDDSTEAHNLFVIQDDTDVAYMRTRGRGAHLCFVELGVPSDRAACCVRA